MVQTPPPPQPAPFIVTLVEEPQRPTTLLDLFLAALGIFGILVGIAIALGVALALVRLWRHRRHPPEEDRLPPISPFVPDPTSRPSSRVP